jgi:hypothetical protein
MPIPVIAETTGPVPLVVALIMGAAFIDDVASQSASPSPLLPQKMMPCGDLESRLAHPMASSSRQVTTHIRWASCPEYPWV